MTNAKKNMEMGTRNRTTARKINFAKFPESTSNTMSHATKIIFPSCTMSIMKGSPLVLIMVMKNAFHLQKR